MSDEGSQQPSPDESPLPPTVQVFHADCPLALYQATKVKSLVEMLGHQPRVFVLGVEHLAALDARGVRMVQLLVGRCRHTRTTLIIGGAGVHTHAMLARAGLLDELGPQNVFPRLREALTYARLCAHR
jgi:MFS superfamily sulfate permease-like transporter